MLQILRFLADEDGATALEYGLLAALIGAFIVASVERLQQNMVSTFILLVNAMTAAVSGGGGS